MKRLLISLLLFTSLFILSCDTPKKNSKLFNSNVKENENSEFNEKPEEKVKSDLVDCLLIQYNEKTIITSLIAIEEFHFLFSDSANLSIVINYGYDIEYLSTQNQGILNKLIIFFNSTDNEIALKGYNRIQSWCSLYSAFNFVFTQIKQGDYDDFNDFGTIMETMNESKSILKKKYLINKGQTYECLSGTQESCFIIDLVTNVSSLAPNEQVLYIKLLLDLLSKH
ncbi:MAG: hypothetical protein H6Q25_1549 [Bacteroidetes bacterium]|nr:hypothetical protein [Bacteroidota bacterium]